MMKRGGGPRFFPFSRANDAARGKFSFSVHSASGVRRRVYRKVIPDMRSQGAAEGSSRCSGGETPVAPGGPLGVRTPPEHRVCSVAPAFC